MYLVEIMPKQRIEDTWSFLFHKYNKGSQQGTE